MQNFLKDMQMLESIGIIINIIRKLNINFHLKLT